MNMGGRHVERSENAYRKRVKGQRHVEVRKETSIHVKERGTVARSPGRPMHTLSVGPQGTTSKQSERPPGFRAGLLAKNSATHSAVL